jgi:small subunit ribosomal protein S20
MAITSSAKKAIRVSERKRVFNLRRRRTMAETVKAARASVGGESSAEALRAAYQAIDKAAKGGIIKKNTAARKKSRLAKLLKKASAK